MERIKILFFIKNLSGGGAEKVLNNLLHRLDPEIFNITVHTIFDEGIYKNELPSYVKYKSTFKKEYKGFVHLQKCCSPSFLHRFFIKEKYDIEIAFLEGVCTRIISGADRRTVKTISWLHTGPGKDDRVMLKPYRSQEELQNVYHCFDQVFAVSGYAVDNLRRLVGNDVPVEVMYNVIEKEKIASLSVLPVTPDLETSDSLVKFCSVGRLTYLKGFHRVIEALGTIKKSGKEHFHYYLLGEGEQRATLERLVRKNGLERHVTFLGFRKNPYQYMRQMDWFVCASYYEGFSSVVCESLIVNLPVITTDCSGMKEILGSNNEYGIICDNTDQAIYECLLSVMGQKSTREYYREKAGERAVFLDPARNAEAIAQRLRAIAGSSN